MATEFKIVLTIDSQGTAKIEEVKRALDEVGEKAGRSEKDGADAADKFATALARKLGLYAALTAAAWGLQRALVSAFQSGMEAVNDFRRETIAIAATITDQAEDQKNLGKVYGDNLKYAQQMYRALELEAAKHFASGKELQEGFNILTQKGVILRQEDISALGTVVDKIKLMTQGQVSSIQIAQELRALLDGQARAASQLALLLRDQLGEEWEELVKKHREAGDLLQWLAGLFPGLQIAVDQIQNTYEAQKSTLETHLRYVGREGLSGAYDWVVEQLKEANAYLEKHGDVLARDIKQAWEDIKPLVVAVKDVMLAMVTIAGQLAQALFQVVGALSRYEGFNAAVSAAMTSDLEGAAAAMSRYREQLAILKKTRDTELGEDPLAGMVAAPSTDRKRGDRGGRGGGGGGGGGDREGGLEAAERQLASFIERMRTELARAEGNAIAVVDAWYNREAQALEKLEEKLGTSLEARKALEDAYNAKRRKAAEEYLAKTVKADEEAQKKFADHYQSSLQTAKGLYEQMASLTPVLRDQVHWKQKALDLEIMIQRHVLETKLLELEKAHIITKAQADELRGLQNLANQYRRYKLQGEEGGLRGWAISRSQQYEAGMGVKGLFTGAEKMLSDAFSAGLQGFLSKDKQRLADVGKNIFLGFVGEIHKRSLDQLWGGLAKIMAPGPSTAGGKDAAAGLGEAAKSLKESGRGLTESGVQLGLSAGGLLLSGIGIATNSEALVIAGTVLQVAGMAIQMYQALTSTTVTAELTGAAVALTSAAAALTSAAATLSAAAGAGAGGGILGTIFKVVSNILPFHAGALVAHSGLAPDERLVVVQAGEGIIKRDTMQAYARAGISFEALNEGRLPTIVGPRDRSDGGGNVVVNIYPRHQMTRAEWERAVRLYVAPALSRAQRLRSG